MLTSHLGGVRPEQEEWVREEVKGGANVLVGVASELRTPSGSLQGCAPSRKG